MTTRTCKVGIHGRNHEEWHDIDFQVLRDAGVEVIKAMSQTRPHHFERMKRELPNVEIITRLYTGAFNTGGHPSASQFAGEMIPVQVLAFFDLLAGPDGGSRRADALRRCDLDSYATLTAGPVSAPRLAALLRQAVAFFQLP